MAKAYSFLRACAVLSSVLLMGLASSAPARAADDPTANARYVGEKVCGDCHDTEKGLFGHTQHAQIFRENPRNDVEKMVCEACHGPGSLHVADTKDKTKIIGFSREWGTPVARMNAQCLGCHDGGQRMYWKGSIHQKNQLACSDCHNPMARFSLNGLMKKPSITETCQSCHQQQRMEFRKKSHMPLPEGKMSCEDCHNPHGSSNKRLLKADTVNEICYQCHAEKRGPFLWEHAPVRENCLNCHEQHGSNNDKLLRTSRPMICMDCHNLTGSMGHTFRTPNAAAAPVQLLGRSCQNCHSQIHGSNAPDGDRFRR
ncbi:MAG: ammonia-forming cytochrome c nitrite reductase subunit c552 [Azoarcus sp.]|nr:ammonia-forming cytochrome c nitrite reductase subunit c552 [Azoarcus sp.]